MSKNRFLRHDARQGTDLKSVPWLNSVPTALPKSDILHTLSCDGKEKNR